MFPVQIGDGDIDERGLFLCQDPVLRQKVLPLFSFDPRASHERPVGRGTTFRIDPWSRCMTAFHVVEDLFRPNDNGTGPILREDIRLAALEIHGLGFGRLPIPHDAWRPIADTYSLYGVERPPLAEPRMRNVTELMVLRIRASQSGQAGTPFLPLDLRRWKPHMGERVMALGYANLDDRLDAGENRPMEQYIRGAFGKIIDIEPADGARGRPWPQIRVEANWPGGMSGGPVFNEAGHVIGVVSTGINGQWVGTAAIFSGWNIPEIIFGSIDANNPGMFWCLGVFNVSGALAFCGQDKREVETFARDKGLTDFGLVSVNPLTDDYIRVQPNHP